MIQQATSNREIDVVVIGGGIAGLQSALDLADQGFKVLVVEREPSIGGHMIALSKVFPTLDCASCITTPKMSAAAHHPNIELMTYTEVDHVQQTPDGPVVHVTCKPRFVDEEKCIGCRLCEYACDMEYPDPFEEGMGVARAIRVPFTNAIPQVAVLDTEYCITCGACAKVCPTDAVDFTQKPKKVSISAGAVVVASGFKLNALTVKPQYNAPQNGNIISPMHMERLLAPHGPYGRVLRPTDGKIPDNIAYVQCAGSRDKSIGVPYCSRVCCMYAIKQAMLLSGALPLADITIYYMDIRAFGKGYEQFYQNAMAMGINFVRGKVARIEKDESGDAIVHVEATDNPYTAGAQQVRHDLVVLSQGMIPQWDVAAHSQVHNGDDGFVAANDPLAVGRTNMTGVFVAGTAAGPKDIVDTIAESGNAAMQASAYLHSRSQQPVQTA